MQKSVFKIGLIFGIIILFQGVSVPFSIHTNQGQVLSITDLTNDVLDVTGKKVSRPNIDIYIISCFQEGKEVELKLQLANDGKIQDSKLIFYEIVLETDLTFYTVDYSNGEVYIADEEGNEIDVIAFSGVGTNELSILFNLFSSDEVCLNLSSVTFEFTLNDEGYFDECPNPVNKAFIFGKYANMYANDNLIIIEAVNIRIVMNKPFRYFHITTGEQIAFSKDYHGIITKQFIIGWFNIYV